MNSENYILIADSHIREDTAEDFFAMLDRIRSYGPGSVVFLGDIFELWIALDGYETGIHRRFLDWCREAGKHFEVGFIVGNHEFYVTERYRDCFSWISEDSHTSADGIRFLHGDLINRSDTGYLLLRTVLRSRLTRFVLKILSGTIGPRISEHVRTALKPTNQQHKRQLPMRYLEEYSRLAAADRVKQIFAGHFHRYEQLDFPGGVPVTILPAWSASGEILCLMPDHQICCRPWRELLTMPSFDFLPTSSGRLPAG